MVGEREAGQGFQKSLGALPEPIALAETLRVAPSSSHKTEATNTDRAGTNREPLLGHALL